MSRSVLYKMMIYAQAGQVYEAQHIDYPDAAPVARTSIRQLVKEISTSGYWREDEDGTHYLPPNSIAAVSYKRMDEE